MEQDSSGSCGHDSTSGERDLLNVGILKEFLIAGCDSHSTTFPSSPGLAWVTAYVLFL